jgi:Raf kinase inhibitor-like YbhB/YbcL family protein
LRSALAVALVAAGAITGCGSSSAGGSGAGINLTVTSPDLSGQFPAALTCDGANTPPRVQWQGAPTATRQYSLVMSDPDAPSGTFIHWVVYGIPAAATGLPVSTNTAPLEGRNDFGKTGYGGPCPPVGPVHHYLIEVHALDTALSLPPGASRADLQAAEKGHVIGTGQLEAMYQRH